MKKHFVKIIVAFVLPLLAISCIEDNVVELTDQGSTFISIYGGHEKKRVCLYGIFFCTILTKR